MSEEITFYMPWENFRSDLVPIGTRVEFNQGVSPIAQEQRGTVISHKWSTIDQKLLNIVKLDDPSCGGKRGSFSPIDTLGVGTHCCHLIGIGEKDLVPGESIQKQLREKDKKKYG